jgi:hypothetical protein
MAWRKRREIDNKYDFRYSVLLMVLATLLHEGKISAEDLQGIGAAKIDFIQQIVRQ